MRKRLIWSDAFGDVSGKRIIAWYVVTAIFFCLWYNALYNLIVAGTLWPYADLLKAVEKFEKVTLGDRRDWRQAYGALDQQIRGAAERILIVNGDTFSYVNVADIAFLEADGGYIFAILKDGRRQLTNLANLQEAIAKVGENSFFQISRRVIVSIDALVKVSKHFRGRLLVRYKAGNEEFSETVSTGRREDFLAWLGN